METFSASLAICAGNSPVTGEFLHKGQWRGALMFSLICGWINSWVDRGEAGDLRRHSAHYDVTLMDPFRSYPPELLHWYCCFRANEVSLNLQCHELGKIFTGPTHKLLLGFTVIPDVHMSFISNRTTFIKYCLTQWISKFTGSFEIHWVRQYPLNFTGLTLADIVNCLQDRVNLHRSRPWQIVLIYNTAEGYG